MNPCIQLLTSPNWKDYELLDCGDGLKLERFGSFTFIRPEVQAIWPRKLPLLAWSSAHAVFQSSGEESGGHWVIKKKMPDQWEMSYPLPGQPTSDLDLEPGIARTGLRFTVMTTPGRHLGVFPECGAGWDWMAGLIIRRKQQTGGEVNVLNLFGYTGLATLACAAAGSKVTHVDASKKSVTWARSNQTLSGMSALPIRWIVDDAVKFVEREARRGVKYDGILLDPPKFGRGPKGEVWEIFKDLPGLLQACHAVLSDTPLFVNLTVYAVRMPAIHACTALGQIVKDWEGDLECGELVTQEGSGGRLLSQAVFARWKTQSDLVKLP